MQTVGGVAELKARDSRPRTALEPFAIVAALCWGSAFPATQVAERTLSPWGVALWRAILGLFFLAAVTMIGGRGSLRLRGLGWSGWWRLAALSMLAVLGFQAFFNFAVFNAGPIIAAFMVSTYPALTVLFSPLFLPERPPLRRMAGALVAVAGSFLLLAGGGAAVVQTNAPLGGLFAVGASVCFALYLLLTRRWTHAYQLDAGTIALFGPIFSGPVFLIAALATAPTQVLAFQPETAGAIVWLGFICSGLAYLAMNHSLRRREASASAPALLLVPIVGAVLSHFALGANLGPVQVAGAAITLLGMLLASL